eukprot:TRINITY_DN364_c0_g1_i3.p1 TRINITY_DN364_c0_g1~~TRINITY_DN364_c0_g1_i3.p1  ORF type:complete len:225 (-),score=44.99 TRINITY_DN364_c0_g1_i3:50-724(-)
MKCFVILLFSCASVFAPFPKTHQLNWVNPFIDPTWQQLDKETKQNVYSDWLKKEPSKKALMDFLEYSDRKKLADAKAWSQAKDLVKTKVKEFTQALKGDHRVPSYTADVKKDPKNPKKLKTVTRYKIESQLQWENFMAAFQYALHIRLAEKRALYQYFLEIARKQGDKKKGEEREMKKNLQTVKDKVKTSYFKFMDKYREKLYKVWRKAEKTKKDFDEEMKKYL